MKQFLILMFSAVFAVTAVAACSSPAAPVSISKISETEKKADSSPEQDNIPRINLEDAKKAFDAGNAVFIDTRGEEAYRAEHIKGAINIPVNILEAKLKDIPAGKKIIAYCS